MRRREFVTLVVGAVATWPLSARAQQPSVATIGVLVHAAPGWERFWQLFPQALRELGYIEGKNIQFEFRSDQGDISRLPELAAHLVRLKVKVIVPWFTPAAIAAKQATREIPIICAACGDMVGTGLVESLDRPGGNVTGNSSLNAELAAKTLDLIREMIPSAKRIAALVNASDAFSKSFLKQIQLVGEATGTVIDPIMIHGAEELDAAFPIMEGRRTDAIIVQPSLPTKRAADLALRYRIPAVCAWRQFPRDGGLAAYFGAEDEMYQRAAVFVDKILKGSKPAELPVEQPTKFELVVNMKTAKALGIAVSQEILVRTDQLIE
ncbi:ABC transporter substrate-binding protein [Bradyrhizobium jicamae]|uniref:ABC transporter substrate-binding protein n=1 Tax=Bradyrhizobium jicamae TaxID=280332 RepID=UPI0028997901|nr:ABC transporter substrate-binding protein [Bradyrhizobium jicamae]